MNAMILAAGRGERLRPYTDTCPKPLLEVKGTPLVEYHLEALARAGIESVVINVSWLADMIEARLGDGSRFGLRITYSREEEALETAGGIQQALPWLDDRFIVVNSDVFTDYDFKQLPEIDTDAHLVLVDNPAHNPAGDFALVDGLIGNRDQDRYTFAGIAVYRKSFFEGLVAGKRALAPLLRKEAEKGHISGEYFDGEWFDIGTVERWKGLG
jgi:MurNAc alpha-1-phosphate uridylyltransferase